MVLKKTIYVGINTNINLMLIFGGHITVRNVFQDMPDLLFESITL